MRQVIIQVFTKCSFMISQSVSEDSDKSDTFLPMHEVEYHLLTDLEFVPSYS